MDDSRNLPPTEIAKRNSLAYSAATNHNERHIADPEEAMLLTVTNLYPRPDEPTRGIFNAQFFNAIADELTENTAGTGVNRTPTVCNLVLVPEWRPWRWKAITRWSADDTNASPTHPEGTSRAKSQYVPVPHIPVIGRNLAWRLHVHALKKHADLFRQASAVLATWLYPDATATGSVASEYGKPFWVKIHGTDRFHMEHKKRGQRIQAIAEMAEGFIPNAQFLADYLVSHGIPPAKVHVIRHGINHTRFHPRPREDALKTLKDISTLPSALISQTSSLPKIVLYVGHLKPIKGPDRLIEALAEVSRTLTPTPHLVMIGVGSMREALEEQAARLGCLDQVHCMGAHPPDVVAFWMNAAHCLCLPSRSEGMPNVVLEALTSGCPVAATDVGDVRHLIRNGANGYLVPNNGPVTENLSTAISRVLTTTWKPEQIAKGTAGLSWSSAAKQFIDLMNAKG